MKVLFIHNTVPEYRINFMKELSKLIEVEFIITDKHLGIKVYDIDVTDSLKDLNIQYLPENKEKWSYLKAKIMSSDYDAVILPPADTVFQYFVGLYALFLSKKNNKKIIYWTEKWETKPKNQPFKKKIKNLIHRTMIGSLAKNSDTCIVAGSKSKEYLNMIGVNQSKIFIAYDSSSSPKPESTMDIRKKYNIPSNGEIILYLGRIIKRKGCDILIESFHQVSSELKDTYLLICGEGDYSDECKDIVEKLGLQNVIFAGKIDPVNRSMYYSQATVFVLPSYSLDGVIEAWGLTVNEAMEYGLPVISTTAVGAAYDLIDGTNGIMIDEKNCKQLSRAIMEIIKNDRNISYRDNCHKTAEKYSVNQMSKKFAEIISL